MKERILSKLNRDLKSKKLHVLAEEIEVPYTTLWRIVHGKGESVSLRTWEKIERFYKKTA